ncbi:MAG TPA: hypothetical protein VFP89_06490 [Propionibacteriaceae bacterium]|nr:hypothetical protein [Propionibacteriaceae bacterium]
MDAVTEARAQLIGEKSDAVRRFPVLAIEVTAPTTRPCRTRYASTASLSNRRSSRRFDLLTKDNIDTDGTKYADKSKC